MPELKPVCCDFFHRFSLLLLEPNEIYFEDFLVNLINEEPSDDMKVLDEQTYIGHLKMCSKSMVFDPKNLELPLIKIAYKNCSRIFIWPGKVNGQELNVLAITCEQYTEMFAKNIVAPYTFKSESRTFLFNFHYAKVYEYLDQLRQLHRASKLHACEQNDMVNLFIFILFKRLYVYENLSIWHFRLQLSLIQGINELNSIHFGLTTFTKQYWLIIPLMKSTH